VRIAVGNGNDLTMIEYAGLGVWVDNVDPELRDKGDFIVALTIIMAWLSGATIYLELNCIKKIIYHPILSLKRF
jgi:hypothetical protein